MSFSNRLVVIVAVVVATLISGYFLQKADILDSVAPSGPRGLDATNTTPALISKGNAVSSAANSVVAQLKTRGGLSDYEMEKLIAWRRDHGYFSEAELEEYKTYDRETLKKLAVDGDAKAMELMARDLIFRGEDALTAFYFAALHGSTHAFLASTWLIESKLLSEEFSEEEKINQLMGALALLTLAGKRGDLLVVEQDMRYFKSHHHFYPTPEQQQRIDATASGMYERMVTQRTAMGLPPFDNTVTPEVQKMAELIRKEQPN